MTGRGRILLALTGALLIAAVLTVVVVVDDASGPPAAEALDPHPESSFQIVALGDSYISGEGAQQYFPGTDETAARKRNLCHRAATAYPYLVAKALHASLRFPACSGARMQDVTGVDAEGREALGQYPQSPGGVFGGHPQLSVLRNLIDPDLVLLSIGGNDAGFAEIGLACANPVRDCSEPRSSEPWLRRLDTVVHPGLKRTYRKVRREARGAPVFVMTYPNPFGPVFCNDLLGVNGSEMAFLRDVFIDRLNQTVKSAAAAAAVGVVDLSHALDGRRFCERDLRDTAINFVRLGRTRGTKVDLRSLPRGSLHPNPAGHALMRAQAMAALRPLVSAAADSAAPTAQR